MFPEIYIGALISLLLAIIRYCIAATIVTIAHSRKTKASWSGKGYSGRPTWSWYLF